MKKLAAGLVAFAALAASACGSLSAYAAVVNGHRITQRSLDSELEAIRGNDVYRRAIEAGQTRVSGSGTGTFDLAFVARILTRDIYFELVHEGVRARKLRVGPNALAAARRTVIRQLRDDRVLKAFPASYQKKLIRRSAEVDVLERSLAPGGAGGDADAALHAYFDSHRGEFERACVSHILVATQAKADEIEGRLAKGEDFGAIARAESQDTGSAANGGSLGCFTRDAQLVPEFLAAAFSQPEGQVGPPVRTSFGFHVIKVTSRSVPSFDDARDLVRQKLQASTGDPLNTWLASQLVRAKVKLNPRFGTFSAAGGRPEVIPPQAPSSVRNPPSPVVPGPTVVAPPSGGAPSQTPAGQSPAPGQAPGAGTQSPGAGPGVGD